MLSQREKSITVFTKIARRMGWKVSIEKYSFKETSVWEIGRKWLLVLGVSLNIRLC